MPLILTSPAFSHNGEIPSRFTCEGEDISPTVALTGAPEGTKSFALIVHNPDAPDPDAPQMTWVHWVLYNLLSGARELPEAIVSDSLPVGAEEGQNDWKNFGYGGPCPLIGRDRYFHKLYALDVVLPDPQLESAMEGHVLAQAELVGTYEKKGQ